jgi:hypothetical protein
MRWKKFLFAVFRQKKLGICPPPHIDTNLQKWKNGNKCSVTDGTDCRIGQALAHPAK